MEDHTPKGPEQKL